MRPVALAQQALVFQHPVIERRAAERRQDAQERHVDADRGQPVGGRQDAGRRLVVEAGDEAGHDADAGVVESLRAAFDGHGDGAAGRNAVVRRIVAGHYLEFAKRVLRRHDRHLAARTAVIRLAAVDQPIVVVGAHAVEAEPESTALRGDAVERGKIVGDAGAERCKRNHVAAVGGELRDLLAGNKVADLVGFGLQV